MTYYVTLPNGGGMCSWYIQAGSPEEAIFKIKSAVAHYMTTSGGWPTTRSQAARILKSKRFTVTETVYPSTTDTGFFL